MSMEAVRHVEMVVPDRIVTVPVPVGLGLDRSGVVMSVMRVMTMDVRMIDGFVTMPVALRFTHESPDTETDEQGPNDQPRCQRFSEHADASDGADERRDGEESGHPRGPQTPERQHVEDQACPIGDHAHGCRGSDHCSIGEMGPERERSREVHGASGQTLRRRHHQRV